MVPIVKPNDNSILPLPLITHQSVTSRSTPAIATTSSESATPIPSEQGQSTGRRGWIIEFDYAKLFTTRVTTSVGTMSPKNINYEVIYPIYF